VRRAVNEGFLAFRTIYARPVLRKSLHTSYTAMGAFDEQFAEAQKKVTTLSERPDNNVMLQLYALFKQSSTGKCNTSKPGAFDFVGKAKWSAWSELGEMSQDDAQKKYIGLVNSLVAADKGSSSQEASTQQSGKYENLIVTSSNRVFTIMINRPQKKNALTVETYHEIEAALKEAESDDSAAVAVITGAGDFYSSGNDLSNFMRNLDPAALPKMAKDGRDLLLGFVGAMIDFPKPLIAAVNGPAIGVACTTLGLCDAVYATDKASFQTPMVALGQSAEGVSSYMFPKIMGQSRANDMLLYGRKINAQQALQWGLVTEVFPDAQFQTEVKKRIEEYAQLPKNALKKSKELIRSVDKEVMHKVNKEECDLLEKLWVSPECAQAIMEFFQKKSKL